MPARLSSPARSENEYDISNALFANDVSESAHGSVAEHNKVTGPFDNGVIPDIMAESSDMDDEAAIAQQQAAANRKASNLKGRTVKKGGGFQALGLNANLLKAITRKGYSVPTPIQRKTVPLILNDKDVVGMARTGSGKTAAFIVPMIEKLKAHSSRVGARALIMSPSRELALQTLQVVKEMGRGTDLKSVLLVGGDSLEEQFASMASNPDIVIATPGRFLHLKVEMGLDLSSIRYVVFDEADRLFEMGFAAQLTEILHSLPASRQTLLFSATLPKTLVEFARAGLQDPVLVRLDADSKISPDLQSVFFTVKSSEKEGALLHILQDVIKVPTGPDSSTGTGHENDGKQNPKKRKRDAEYSKEQRGAPSPHSTIIFAATKHHVEYLAQILRLAGYAVSHVYGALDQTARKDQVYAFRSGFTNILVVTDVAARGIDIPILANVINYDFPSQPKIFVHRVGRTARAGQNGWSYSIVHDADAPYLLDLQLFLGRRLIVGRAPNGNVNFATDVVLGSMHRDRMQSSVEWVSKTLEDNIDIAALRVVAMKGEKLYQRTRNSASSESAKRARMIVASNGWTELHPLFNDESDNMEAEREKMLARVGGFRPQESIFEIGARRGGRKGNEEAVDAMRKIRSVMETKKQKLSMRGNNAQEAEAPLLDGNSMHESDSENDENLPDHISMASDSELEVTFSRPEAQTKSRKKDRSVTSEAFRDAENFMSYAPRSHSFTDDRAYGVHSGSNANFAEAARGVTMDIAQDEAAKGFGEARGIMRWDKRQKKYVARQNDDDGSKGKRLVRGESGAKIAASFRSGRYDAWRRAQRVGRVPRVGEKEADLGNGQAGAGLGTGKRYRHKSMKAPKQADRLRDDYDKRKKKVQNAEERAKAEKGNREIRSVDDIRKQRNLKERRREKNARPSKKARR
jgi:ATP-dependent RNA helicase DDX54/DBP10